MEFDKTIRENLNGKYLIIHAHQLKEGIDFAFEQKLTQIQLRGVIGKENIGAIVDFRELEKLSETLKVISFSMIGETEEISNPDYFYSLRNLEKIYFQSKQKFEIDLSKFSKLNHLGAEYWKGLSSFPQASSIKSIVFTHFPHKNLEHFASLSELEILHLYSSKIETLNGIKEIINLKELCLSRNSKLENIKEIEDAHQLRKLTIEKCNKISDYSFLSKIKTITKNIDKLNKD